MGSFIKLTGELVRQFRHISAIAATSSFLAVLGIFATALSDPVSLIFQTLFFGLAALPLVALSIRQTINLFRITDLHAPSGRHDPAEDADTPETGDDAAEPAQIPHRIADDLNDIKRKLDKLDDRIGTSR
jgi:hypothetical protein